MSSRQLQDVKSTLCNFTLPEYDQEVGRYITNNTVTKLIEEYLLNEQFVISKILIAATIKDLPILKKYYDPSKIILCEECVIPRQSYLISHKLFNTVLNIASYSILDELKPKSMEMVAWLVSTVNDKTIIRSINMPGSIEQIYNQYGSLSTDERKAIIRKILFGCNTDYIPYLSSIEKLFPGMGNFVGDELVLVILMILTFSDLSKDKVFFDLLLIKINYSLNRSASVAVYGNKIKDVRSYNEICIVYYLLPYLRDLKNLESKHDSLMSLGWTSLHDVFPHALLISSYFGIELQSCKVSNLFQCPYDH